MKILNWDINFKKVPKEKSFTMKQTDFLKMFDTALQQDHTNMRTSLDQMSNLSDGEIKIPYYPLDPRTLYDLAYFSDTFRIINNTIKTELFRPGLEIIEKFSKKCNDCGKEFSNPVQECNDCIEDGKHGTNLRNPQSKQKQFLEKAIKCVNENRQPLKKLCQSHNDDHEIMDNAYMICNKDYTLSEEGDILEWEVKEFTKGLSYKIWIIADDSGRPGRQSDGQKVYTCINHRDTLHRNQETCPICGLKLHQAFFKGEYIEGKYFYYIDNEVLHTSKYQPTLTYGFSNLYSAWMKIITLMNQDKYISDYYSKQRPPRGLLFVKTSNADSLQKAWQWMLDKFRKNPHMISPISIDSKDSNGKFIEFVDFMRSLDDMQFIEMREEYRKVIGALYHVSPIWSNDISTSGGLNNEGHQLTISNRGSEKGQSVYNEDVYPWMLKQWKITDYDLILLPTEEQDEMAELVRREQEIRNAQLMQSMGFEVTMNEDERFEFGPMNEPVKVPSLDMGLPSGIPDKKPTTPEQTRISGETKNAIKKINRKIKNIDKVIKENDAYRVM